MDPDHNHESTGRHTSRLIASLAVLGVITGLQGCGTTPGGAERAASEQLATVGSVYRPAGVRPTLPELQPSSSAADFVRFAILNHPAIEAAFHDWRATVAAIPTARGLADPQLTFEADIMEKLVTFMPGVMFEIMNGATRRAMADQMSAESETAYRTYLAEIQRTAVRVHLAWLDCVYAEEAIALHAAMLTAFDEAAATAAAEYVTGRGMATLETQVRLRNEAGMHHTEHHATAAQRRAARARLKAALGIADGEPNPPWPTPRLVRTPLPPREELWRQVLESNPELAVMRAMIDMAVAEIVVAERARSPNFMLGAMVDVKASPLMFRPTGSVSLPVFREKIAAGINAASARRDAAIARVSSGQLMLAADFAQMLYMVNEADEMLTYIESTALPNLENTVATAAAGYESGLGGATMIAELQAMKIEMAVRRLNALRARESAAVQLLLLARGAELPLPPAVAAGGN